MSRKWQHIRWQAPQNEHNHSSLCVPVPISFRSHLPISVQKQCAVHLPKYSLSCVNSHLAALQKVVSFYHHSNFREVSKPESMDIESFGHIAFRSPSVGNSAFAHESGWGEKISPQFISSGIGNVTEMSEALQQHYPRGKAFHS